MSLPPWRMAVPLLCNGGVKVTVIQARRANTVDDAQSPSVAGSMMMQRGEADGQDQEPTPLAGMPGLTCRSMMAAGARLPCRSG